eukprot:CAMPEP_0170517174 /NCGR_PEP_ID=MMETSP0209-20121228/3232_1 /TAXON_ID=665100 ORGANISM="Litonotus pictus, Strain P1" /NCGR_SAMPLE_ID=MMETSP0209 /ASSEMBLY_ACC=CAM_ASM_000301 /LENGTH=572 /DNA_ID=CAMNT_0010802341 /DNA_START=176 /DNA_END=1894 /DNA_ORIENTATION=-
MAQKKESTSSDSKPGSSFKFKSSNKYISDTRKTWKYPVDKDEILEEWMTISSWEFLNIKRFPPVKLSNGTIINIEVNSLNFRLNKAYNCTDPARPVDERLFWFRLSNNSLYYSSTKTDINILGYITITEVYDIDRNTDISGEKENFCFNLKDDVFKEWRVCNENKETVLKWYCTIRRYLKLDDDVCWGIPRDPNQIIKKHKIKKSIIMVPLASPTCNEGWDYSQAGDDWVCDCKEGVEQSPIDLPKIQDAIESPVKPIFTYKDVEAINEYSTLDGNMVETRKLELINDDNMLHLLHYDFGKAITNDGAEYQAQEITFHTPANHKIDGKEYPLEITIIHFGVTKGDIGKQLTLSFLFEAVPGVYNQFIDDLDVFNLPDPVNKRRGLQRSLFIPKILYDQNNKLNNVPVMKPFSFYTYSGSLPFPPCTERTIALVASKPMQVSTTAISLLKEALRMPDLKSKTGDVFTSNKLHISNRHVQPLNGRPVYFYDHQKNCGPDPVPLPPKPSGHYEKVLNRGTQFFYVNGPEPSGLPGAFVVSEQEAKGLAYSNDEKRIKEREGHDSMDGGPTEPILN